MKIFKSLINKIMGPKVDYSTMNSKEYPLKFKLLYEEFKCNLDKKTELKTQMLDLINVWIDQNKNDKNFTYCIIIVFADEFKVKLIEELMERAENQIAEDNKYSDWFKMEAQKNLERKRIEGDHFGDIDKFDP